MPWLQPTGRVQNQQHASMGRHGRPLLAKTNRLPSALTDMAAGTPCSRRVIRRRAHGEPPTSHAAAVRAGAWPARRPRGSVFTKTARQEGCHAPPSASCGVVALRPQRPHPPSCGHAVAHGLAPVGEHAALFGGDLPVVALERLTDVATPHLDGDERLVGLGLAALRISQRSVSPLAYLLMNPATQLCWASASSIISLTLAAGRMT